MLCGLIWFVQLVHYPLLLRVGTGTFSGYELAHQRLTGRLVAPLMLAELAAAVLLCGFRPGAAAYAGLALLGLIWGSTFLVQMPLHARLGAQHDPVLIRRLIRSNWLRTLAWTLRGLLAAALLGGS